MAVITDKIESVPYLLYWISRWIRIWWLRTRIVVAKPETTLPYRLPGSYIFFGREAEMNYAASANFIGERWRYLANGCRISACTRSGYARIQNHGAS
jgi:hypothetical protein